MPQISERGRLVPASPIRKLVPYADQAVAKGIKVYGLNIGQPDIPTPQVALDAIRNIDRKVLAYTDSAGNLSLRKKMAEYYHRFNIPVDPSEIIVTAGGSEAVLFSLLLSLNPGDEVLIPEPAYANYISFARTAGATVIGVPADIANGFALPPIEEFEKRITPRTKAILICNPNNPTGYVYSHDELNQLCWLVKKYDLFLFSDEVYREFYYTLQPPVSALQMEGIDDRCVLIDSVSKRYNECGIRIGNLVVRNKELRDAIMKFCQARLSPPLLGQIVAEASIDTPQEFMEECFAEYRRRRDFMVAELNKIPGVYSPLPEGAFYTVVSLPVTNAEDFCKWCLEEFSYEGQTVFMAPATGFYSEPGMGLNQVRIAYVLEIPELAKAVKVLEKALEAYHSRF